MREQCCQTVTSLAATKEVISILEAVKSKTTEEERKEDGKTVASQGIWWKIGGNE